MTRVARLNTTLLQRMEMKKVPVILRTRGARGTRVPWSPESQESPQHYPQKLKLKMKKVPVTLRTRGTRMTRVPWSPE